MLNETFKQVKTAIMLLLLMTILTGLVYPVLVTGIAQILFPAQANGSFIKQDNKIVGSKWIGQYFTEPKYFWGRPSATAPFPYNAAASSGSNLGPTNPALLTAVKGYIARLREADPHNSNPIPVDLVTASASGLDPEISPAAAFYQVPRIAAARNLSESKVNTLVRQFIKQRQWGILGEPRVNVLQLNLALDALSKK